MNIPVVFCKWGNEESVAQTLGDCYILSGDNWDDSGYKTYFNVYIYKDGEEYGKFGRKILFDNQNSINSSSSFLETLYQEPYLEMSFVKENYNYISLGYEYEELKKIFLSREEFESILKILNDVIYLEKKEPENTLLQLKKDEGFELSLCRDQSSKKLLEEGVNLLYGDDLDLNRMKFSFNFDLNEKNYNYNFDFIEGDIPSRINVLIGKNGSGKSQTLLSLSTYFINPQQAVTKFNTHVDSHPNFISNLMVFAYNTYEDFYVNRNNEKLNIDYKYLGLKKANNLKNIEFGNYLTIPNGFYIINYLIEKYSDSLEKELIEIKKEKKINNFIDIIFEGLTQYTILKENISDVVNKLISDIFSIKMDINNPLLTTFNSFKEIYNKDRNNYAHKIQLDDITYRNKVIEFLKDAFDCTAIGLKIIENREYYESQGFEFFDNYLILKSETISNNIIKEIRFEDFEQKLYFFDNTTLLFLSSGQQTFVDLVINLLSLIKNNTLVLVDEPENTLHPNLEIDYIKILNDILDEFDSFAIIATHSPLIVREVSTKYVNVIKLDKETNELSINHPSIGTFGGDIGTISNYVFDDILKDKKLHQNWFEKEVPKYNNFEEFESKYRDILNYDFLLYCKNNWNSSSGF